MIAILDNNDQLLCVTEDYFDSNLHTFLQGTAAFFSCSILQKSEMAQHFKVGSKISFVYNEIAYHFDITDMVKNETYVTIQADTLTLELRNEDSAEYKATKAMTFEEYLKVFLFVRDNPLVMGINEVSDKKLKLEWEGSEESILARLFSLANKFNAEIEFVTKLNRHWGLDKIVLNVYVANDDKHQGIGKNRQDVILEYGNNVETIEVHENIDNLKTMIKPIGKDGLTIGGVEIEERDKDGTLLFLSTKDEWLIRAVHARNQFVSKVGGEGYILKNWTYETENKNTLAGQALAELKKLSKVELTVTIKAYEKLNIGDTVRAQNKAYQPTLNLSVRVSEQDIYFEEPSKNTTTFTNVEILKSAVDESLLSRVQELIKENKKYEYQIISDNGTVFKNNQGQTILTARVLDGAKDITDDLDLSWSKDGMVLGSNKTLTVKASDIIGKSVYRFEVLDEDGLSKGGNEVTVTNVNDGKDALTSYIHTAWATGPSGENMILAIPPDSSVSYDYFGVYSDTNKIASTNPLSYEWNKVLGPSGKDGKDGGQGVPGKVGDDGKTPYIHTAYSFAPDGSKWFGTEYPNVNLFRDKYVVRNSILGCTGVLEYLSSGAWANVFMQESDVKQMLKPNTTYSCQYVFTLLSRALGTTPHAQNNHGTLLLYNPTAGKSNIILGGTDGNVNDAATWSIGTKRTRKATFTTPSDLTGYQIIFYTLRSMKADGSYNGLEKAIFSDIKFEETENSKPDNTTLVTVNPEDNPDLALPTYTGTYADYTAINSTDPDKYTWVLNRGEAKMHVAWANKDDGTDMVITWPRPNELDTQNIGISSNNNAQYPHKVVKMTEGSRTFQRVSRDNPSLNPYTFSVYSGFSMQQRKMDGKRLAISVEVRANASYDMALMSYSQNTSGVITYNYDNATYVKVTPEWNQFTTVWESVPEDSNIIRFMPYTMYGHKVDEIYIDYGNWKFEFLPNKTDKATPYFDYQKAIEFDYLGTYTDNLQESSNDPKMYAWNRTKGEIGPSLFTWIMYADDSKGTNMSYSPSGKLYLGIAENKIVSTASTNAADYKWSPMTDEKGLTQLEQTINSVPRTFVQSTMPVNTADIKLKNGDQWWVMSNNKISAYNVYANGKWIDQKMEQGLINITSLNAVNITGSNISGTNITGSVITSIFDKVAPSDPVDPTPYKIRGTTKMTDGMVRIDSEKYNPSTGKVVETFIDTLSAGEHYGKKIELTKSPQGIKQYILRADNILLSDETDSYTSVSVRGVSSVDMLTGKVLNLNPTLLFDTGWIVITGTVSYRIFLGCLYINFDNWGWNKTGEMGVIPKQYVPRGEKKMFLVPGWNTSGADDNFQLNADGRLERKTNRCGVQAFNHTVNLGPID